MHNVPKPKFCKIVIHHSSENYRGKVVANAHILHLKGLERGLGGVPYNFVIGNGKHGKHRLKTCVVRGKSIDGGIELGLPLYSTKGDAISVCLVGNFNVTKPTPKQLESLKYLVLYLLYRYELTPHNVFGHRECKNVNKRCPGKNFDIVGFRNEVLQEYERSRGRKGEIARWVARKITSTPQTLEKYF